MKVILRILLWAYGLFFPVIGFAQTQSLEVEMLPYGDFENWLVRLIKESAVVGGRQAEVYAIADRGLIEGNEPYVNTTSPWASSNVYAEVFGVKKVNVNVRPHSYEGGTCASLRTEQISFRVLGMMRMNVLTAGAIYLGRVHEPVKSMDDTYACVDMGIPFTKKPQCLLFDYAAEIGNSGTLHFMSGTKKKEYPGYDKAQILVQLQRRWEEDGKIYAQRIATGEMLIGQSTSWRKDCRLDLEYGEPAHPDRLSEFGRLNRIFHATNSKGASVPVIETAYAPEGTEPTHLIVFISSGSLGAYRGEIGNTLLIDNVRLGYGAE